MKNYFRVEKRVGRGAQHIVGKLRDGQLIKYPHWTGTKWDISTPETVRRDLAIHRRWGNPIPETSVVVDPTIEDGQSIVRPPYAVLAEQINGRVLREIDLANPDIREQFQALAARSLDIRNHTGTGIDFMGFESIGHLFRHFLGHISAEELGTCNVLIDARDQIKLIDTSLLSPARAPIGIGWIIDYMIDVEHSLIAEVLQDKQLRQKSAADNRSRLMTRLARQIYSLSRPKPQPNTGSTISPLMAQILKVLD